jgi:predicted transcriptional regulator
MKTPSSLPKRLEIKVTGVARRLRKPAQRVLAEAIEEYVARHDPAAITEAMNRVADAIDTRPGPPLASAAKGILESTEW